MNGAHILLAVGICGLEPHQDDGLLVDSTDALLKRVLVDEQDGHVIVAPPGEDGVLISGNARPVRVMVLPGVPCDGSKVDASSEVKW